MKKTALVPLVIVVVGLSCIGEVVVYNVKRAIPKSVDFVWVRASFTNPHSYRVVWTRSRHENIGEDTFVQNGPFMYGTQQPLPNKN